ncbi:MAG: insulinase family protein [Clostridiales bacterium]|nr:insulinase family protein [Clostridiales bacterium]
MVKVHRLSNGIRVVLEPMEYVHSASIGIYVKAGSAYETRENNGIAHVTEHMLFKGTNKRTAKELATAFARIGGGVNAYTAKEETCYYAMVLDEHLEEVIELLGDMLVNSRLDSEDLKKELEVILEEIDMYQDSPEDLAIEHLQEVSMPDSSLGYLISGKKEVVSQFTKEHVKSFMEDFYTAERMVISVAGNFSSEKVLTLLEKQFGMIKPIGKKIVRTQTKFHPAFSSVHKDTEQIHLTIGFQGCSYTSEDKYAQDIFEQCFGDSDDSRLFQKLREDLGLVYSIYSFCNSYNDMGLFQIYGAMNGQKVEKAVKEIGLLLKELRQQGITKEELFCAKERVKADLLIGLDSSENRMAQNGKSLLLSGQLETMPDLLERTLTVSKEDVMRYIKQYIQLEKTSLVLVGNRTKRNDQIVKSIWSHGYQE